MSGFQVEQTYWNCGGVQWTRRLPKVYRRRKDAEKAALRLSWAVRPDGGRLVERSSARVVEGGAP
jgi:hypothetical protein